MDVLKVGGGGREGGRGGEDVRVPSQLTSPPQSLDKADLERDKFRSESKPTGHARLRGCTFSYPLVR